MRSATRSTSRPEQPAAIRCSRRGFVPRFEEKAPQTQGTANAVDDDSRPVHSRPTGAGRLWWSPLSSKACSCSPAPSSDTERVLIPRGLAPRRLLCDPAADLWTAALRHPKAITATTGISRGRTTRLFPLRVARRQGLRQRHDHGEERHRDGPGDSSDRRIPSPEEISVPCGQIMRPHATGAVLLEAGPAACRRQISLSRCQAV